MIGKRMKKVIRRTVFAMGMMVLCAVSCPHMAHAAGVKIVDADGETVKKKILLKGDKEKLFVLSTVSAAQKVIWKSSDTSVVKVTKKGMLYAKKAGSARVTVRLQLPNKNIKKKAVCKIYVKKAPKKIQIKTPRQSCYEGEKIACKAVVSPKDAYYEEIVWKSSKPQTAVISDDGVIQAVKQGKTTITAQIEGTEIKKKIKIFVLEKEPEKKEVKAAAITTNYINGEITMEHGTQTQLMYSVAPEDTTETAVTFHSSDKTNVAVSKTGLLTALRPGIATVQIQSAANKDIVQTVKVTVTANERGFLTDEILSAFDLTSIDNLMIVAHPDDEAIFGGGHLAEDDYFVLCLTNGYNNTRKAEFEKCLAAANDKGIILSYPDMNMGVRSDWAICSNGIFMDLNKLIQWKKWETIVTHNPEGEYGHQHHKMTNQKVTYVFDQWKLGTDCELLYFGKYYSASDYLAGLADVEKMPESVLKKKESILSHYVSQKSQVDRHWHMNPWEDWLEREKWESESDSAQAEANS